MFKKDKYVNYILIIWSTVRGIIWTWNIVYSHHWKSRFWFGFHIFSKVLHSASDRCHQIGFLDIRYNEKFICKIWINERKSKTSKRFLPSVDGYNINSFENFNENTHRFQGVIGARYHKSRNIYYFVFVKLW